ncbi:discoidin domain-containing receptor 2-like [Cimex lectularius]|uniref:Discoidin domain-containing receptor 2-like n=1 Tax=Cimex lectularius TaxID=79782 RepID=A0A8I6SLX9_CIMLE|nr:discoidin domain-containing receptor 2-like [Cimex lectularius]
MTTYCLLLPAVAFLLANPTEAGECSAALGMEEGRIPDTAISASSSYETKSVGPQNARIRQELNGGAWCPKAQISSEVREYLEVDLTKNHLITKTETQGRFGNGQGQEYAESFLVEYWRESLNQWVVYKNTRGQKVLAGNTNTYLVVRQDLDLPFIASKVRFIPYSEHPRTVCMRVEIYGCPWEQSVVGYSAPRGDSELEDLSYDGFLDNGIMHGGLGQLTDSLYGSDDFLQETRDHSTGSRWVGWMNESQQSDSLELLFQFDNVRKFSAMNLYTSHIVTREVQVFSSAVVSFSIDGERYQPNPVKFLPRIEKPKETAFNVTIPLHGRVAKYVKVQLHFSARWILLSEVTFDSVLLSGNLTEEESLDQFYLQPEENEVEKRTSMGGETTHARKEVTPATSPSGRTQAYIGLITGVLAMVVLLLGCTVLLMIRRGRKKVALLHKHTSLGTKPGVTINMKELKMTTPIINNGVTRTRSKPSGKGLYGHMPGEESEDSENSSVYHEPYKLLPSTKQEYGCLIKKDTIPSSKSADYNTGLCRSLDFTSVNSFQEEVKFSSPSLYNLTPPPPPSSRPPPYEMSTNFNSTATLNKANAQPVENYYAATDIIKTERREQHLTPGKFTPLKLPEGSPEDSSPLLEFSRHRLRVIEKMGEGSFGMIHLCETEGVPEYNGITSYHKKQVVVKSVWRGCTESTKKEFLHESAWMGTLRDPNVARVVGVCSQEEPFCILQEYCEFGDLPTFLQLQSTSPDEENPALSYGCLIYMATQVASGMKYLESLDLAHRDLAARNCLVGKSYHIKVSDHAMYCTKYETDYYISDTKAKLPIRWMAWESLLLGKATTKSDVWSFGVTLWEMLVVCGQKPFGELTSEQVVENCNHWYQGNGQARLLSRPNTCPREIYDLMTECWKRNEADRPRFSEIHLFLQRKNLGYVPVIA